MASITDEKDPLGLYQNNDPLGLFGGKTEPEKPKKRSIGDIAGDLGTALLEGTKATGRMAAAGGNTLTGDLADVESYAAAQKAAAANAPAAKTALMQDIERRKAENKNPTLLSSIVDVAGAAAKNPEGTAQFVVEQAPNSAVVLGTGLTGMKAGAALGTAIMPGVGTVVGGIAGGLGGLFLGNSLLETGGKAIEKAEGGFTADERKEALREGAVKGAVISGVDAATLGAGSLVAKSLGRAAIKAGAEAEARVLADAGVNLSSREAIEFALVSNPALKKAAQEAGQKAASAASTLKNRAVTAGTVGGMETVGEGAGEYFGELAATGEADYHDAALEALAGLTQSAPEAAWAMRRANGNRLSIDGIAGANVRPSAPGQEQPAAATVEPPPAGPYEAFSPDEIAAFKAEQAANQKRMAADLGIARGMAEFEREQAKAQLGGGAIGRAAAAGIDSGAIAPAQVTGIGAGIQEPGAALVQKTNAKRDRKAAERNQPVQGAANGATGSGTAQVAQAGGQGAGNQPAQGVPAAVEPAAGGGLDAAAGGTAPGGAPDLAAGTAAGGAGVAAQPTGEPTKDAAKPEQVAQEAGQAPSTQSQAQTEQQPAKPVAESQAKAAPGKDSGLSVGTTPKNAEPITVRNGVVYQGDYEALNAETGDPITVPEGADNAAIAQSLRDGKVLSSKQKIYGLGDSKQDQPADLNQQAEPEAAPDKETKADGSEKKAAKTKAGGEPNAHGVIPKDAPGVEKFALASNRKGWKGADDATLHVAELEDGRWVVAGSYNEANGGFSSPLAERHGTYATRAEAVEQVVGEIAKHARASGNKLHGARVLRWLRDTFGYSPEPDQGKQAKAEGKPTTEEKPAEKPADEGWRTNAIKAGALMKKLGIERKNGMKLADMVAAIEARDAGKAEKPDSQNVGKLGIDPDKDENAPQWAGAYDVVEKGGAPEGYRLLGSNPDGNPVYEAGDMRAVVDGDYIVRELGHKPKDSRVAEFRTTDEISGRTKAEKPAASKNTIFTDAAAEAARALLKKKLGNLNSGIDPEVMQAGITLAGYHIEKGARTFAAFTKAMIEDMGEIVKPYLKSWYMGVKYDPRAASLEGMSSAAEVEAFELDTHPAVEQVIGEKPKAERKKKKAAIGVGRTLKQDWGVESINGYDSERDDGAGGVKADFLKDAKAYLREVAAVLAKQGYVAPKDRNGKEIKHTVSVNEGGMAGSGEVSLSLFNQDLERGIYVHIGDSSLRGVVPMTKSGITVMARVTKAGDPHGGSQNHWMETDLTAGDLAETLHGYAKAEAGPKIKTIIVNRLAGTVTEETRRLEPQHTEQYENYRKWIEDGHEVPAGMAETISQDTRLQDGEAEELLAMAEAEKPQDAQPQRRELRRYTKADGRQAFLNGEPRQPLDPKTTSDAAAFISGWDEANAAAPVDNAAGQAKNESQGGTNDDAGSVPTQAVPAARAGGDHGQRQDGDRDSEPLDAGLAATGEGVAGSERVPGGTQESGRSGEGRRGERGGHEPSDAEGDRGSVRPQDGAARPELADHEITDADEIGKGGLGKKYRDNIAAIKIIKALEADNRVATAEERKALAKYVGWGALKGVFDPANKQWAKQHKELRDLLNDTEWESARASVLNAHYTSPAVVKAIYEAVDQLGFKGGRILEPSMGSGNFFGLMPKDLRNGSKLHGVELDNLTSRLARALYPNAVIATSTGFQEYQVPAGYFDMAIGNPPFGSEPIVDRERSEYSGWSIHNYFIARMIDKTRDGGIVPVIVSHSFMDALNPRTREWVAQRANLLGAVRLPDTAFQENAGTEVVTDILFFQKTASPEKNPAWVNVSDIELTNDKTGETAKVGVNDYFQANPRNVLGRQTLGGTMYRANSYTVEAHKTGDIEDHLTGFINSLPANVYQPIERKAEELDAADNTVPDGIKPGSYYVDGKGVIRQRGNDVAGMNTSRAWTVPTRTIKGVTKEVSTAVPRMKAMIQLRDLLRAQMRMELSENTPQDAIESARRVLNERYDAFLKEFGYLNGTTNRRMFMEDTESALLQALEFDYDPGMSAKKAEENGLEPKPESATKADILTRRVLFPPKDEINVTNAKDALLASLNAKGKVDPSYMSAAYGGKAWGDIERELGDVIFNDPQAGYVTADEYLSGDVKTKLAEAKAAMGERPAFERNVKALEKVIPADKLPSEIFASMGANWIPADVYQAFAKEITGSDKVRLSYVAATAQWLTSMEGVGDAGKMSGEYGTDKISALDLFGLLMNGRAPEIKKRVADPSTSTGYRYVTDEEATEAARSRADKIKQTWESWVWNEGERAERLAGIYNDKHNRTVGRGYDGSHLTMPGATPAITLRAHQKNVIWRAIQERNVLMDHVVGAGKTFAMIGTIMEMKRLGIARKPIFAVPNHLTLQWRSDFSRLYPASNVLAATPEDFSKDNRERLFAKIATGDYDAVVIGHSSLTKIGLDPAIEQAMYKEQLDSIADAIEDMKRERGDKGIIRDMEKIKANLEAKIETLLQKAGERDKVLSFNELGIDALFVDEMHEFKNLFFYTQKQRVSGLGNPAGSGKAFDLFMKVRWMQETLGEKAPLITATGTPVSNSLAEMFTMQRYMRYPELKREGLHLFDAWARMYGEDEYVYEVAPSGVGYRISQRFSKFKNLPALMGHYQGFADVVTLQDLKDQAKAEGKRFPVPKIEGGRPQNIVAQRSEQVRDFFGVPVVRRDEHGRVVFEVNNPETAKVEENPDAKEERMRFKVVHEGGVSYHATREEAELWLAEKSMTPVLDLDKNSIVGQFNNLKALTRATKGKINALSLTGLANKAGLDYRLIDPAAPDFPGSKINKAVDKMVEKYHQWDADKGTQLVFCDLSVPLSAKAAAAKTEKRLYVRDDAGVLTHKKGTLHTIDGRDGFPFYLVKQAKTKTREASVMVYEPVSGIMLRGGFADKAAARAWVEQALGTDQGRDRWYELRDSVEAITPDMIAEYRDEHELEVDEEGSNEVSMDDLEAISGATGFSVYDDIKAKLVARGIPEHEIAFIHDYHTPKQKEALFKRVNSGAVRFLFGSTPKLGAGTNVQERLVGLHHIDAPWRPSDLEQREGRIIRQGNKLYERDPDGFEVFIGRYATEQTYDTRRWQLLEHKASGIEQLRKYSGEAEIEDVSGEAANAADMKAAASGNPLILEETKLRTEVKRLTALRRAHEDGKFAMQGKIKHLRNTISTFLPERLGIIEDAMRAVAKHPAPTEKGAIPAIVIDGKKAKDREDAEKRVGELATRVRAGGMFSGGSNTVEYRGVPFKFDRNRTGTLDVHHPYGTLVGYATDETVSNAGLITRMGNFVERLATDKQYYENQLEQDKKDLASLEANVNNGFEGTQELAAAVARHAVVQRKLMKSTQLDAVPPERRAAFQKELDARKKQLIDLGYSKAVKEATQDDGSDTAFSVAPFYSPLARAIDSAKFESAPAGQWKLWLAGNAAKLGVKKDEIQWSGVNEWLDLQGKGKVSKADVLAYLDQNGVRVEEVTLSDDKQDIGNELWRMADDGLFDRARDTYDAIKSGASYDEIARAARREGAVDVAKVAEFGNAPPTKFASYQLPGGENYRELLLTLPQKTPEFELRTIAQMKDFLAQNKGVADSLAGLSDVDKLKKLNRMRAKEGAMQTFQSSHFEQKNILAHVRFNERTDADGKRVLFIEEIQSDFGQSFKKQRDAINRAVDADFEGIVERMKKAGVLEVNCD